MGEALRRNSGEIFEVKEESVDDIYNSIKSEMTKMFEKYKGSDKDLTIAIMASYCISADLKQKFSDKLGAYKIIKSVEERNKY